MGNSELAIERAERAIRLSPFDPLNYLAYNALAVAHLADGRAQAALEAARESVEINPRFSVCHLFLVAALVLVGQPEEARSHAGTVMDLDPEFSTARFRITVGYEPKVFDVLAEAWRKAGLPEG